jgi:hypothetical protein
MARTRPSITLAFSGPEPSFDVLSMVERIVDSVPESFLVGLTDVVLTNASTLPRSRRRGATKSRGRKVRIKEAGGLYHPATQQRGAWIEIFVDNVLNRRGRGWLSRTNWFRETELSEVLFHEIGHHIHYTVRPEHREKEDVADIWKARLQRNYIRQRYRWVRFFVSLLHLGGLANRWHAKVSAEMHEKGYISRAEHEEWVKGKKKVSGE